MFQAKDIMSTDVVTIDPEDMTDRAVSLLVEHRISGLPVVDDAGNLVGVITEFDLLDLICDFPTENGQVHQYMSSEVQGVEQDASWVEIADIFRMHTLRRLPVTHDGKLVGIIARHDLMRAIQQARRRVRGKMISAN